MDTLLQKLPRQTKHKSAMNIHSLPQARLTHKIVSAVAPASYRLKIHVHPWLPPPNISLCSAYCK
ncbi:hypothetical protein MKW92_018333, partial [Papaver armeniacum]